MNRTVNFAFPVSTHHKPKIYLQGDVGGQRLFDVAFVDAAAAAAAIVGALIESIFVSLFGARRNETIESLAYLSARARFE